MMDFSRFVSLTLFISPGGHAPAPAGVTDAKPGALWTAFCRQKFLKKTSKIPGKDFKKNLAKTSKKDDKQNRLTSLEVRRAAAKMVPDALANSRNKPQHPCAFLRLLAPLSALAQSTA
jgi:hypothetical protein